MKYKFKKVEHPHKNDCWCIAYSLMLNKNYDKLYKQFKPFLDSENVISKSIEKGYLNNEGLYNIELDSMDLKDVLRIYNFKNGAILTMTSQSSGIGHTVYIKDNLIYEDLKEDMLWWYIDNYCVELVAIKLEDYE